VKADAHPTDARLLDVARQLLKRHAKRAGLGLKQTYERECQALRRRAGGYAHAKQFKRLKTVLKRQRTILGVLIREITRKMAATSLAEDVKSKLTTLLQRAERIRPQKTKDKNKLYTMHAREVECIGRGKARKPYEFGVKTSIAATHGKGLLECERTFPGSPYVGHTLAAQIEQTTTLLESIGTKPNTAFVDLNYRGVDQEVPGIEVTHRGKSKRLTARQKAWLRRRHAIEPVIGHARVDHRMDRCWLKGQEGDALHAVLCETGFNIRWLMSAILRQAAKATKAFFFGLFWLVNLLRMLPAGQHAGVQRARAAESRGASVKRVGDRLAHMLAVCSAN
jgi:IS5 family transposase